ncbi:bifunctional riboflavin kinase/FAD synthetase [Nocardiopsis ansamitocini]|uniref:Riboflavin biosynthesis protein n=1 Tax=Nocardiopsis ansamitocini TaxID=1670832 RepID=A0A9W6P3H3_9ACTN|nr:bifunctional riboflavin kinase/FAD synthetase [Nocardiopsis ansamitocini]GLU46438.1 riboflavin biosynthesis protein [Nocardiopsis ansamitocini]
MRRWHGLDEVPEDWGRCVVTVGSFDGVHLGHQEIVRQAVGHASRLGVPVVAVAFEPDSGPGTEGVTELTGPDHKTALLADRGVDALCLLSRSPGLTALSAEDFVREVLVDRLHAATLVVKEGFRFGHRAEGDLPVLRELGTKYGFTVESVVPLAENGRVSSARIRSLLADGDVEAAATLLGRAHLVEGVVVHGAARGRALLGFPTANLDVPPTSVVPADGVYAGWLSRTGPCEGEARWPAAISVGTNPTFGEGARTVEAYALDRDDLDLYGLHMAVEFTHHIRPTLRFDSVDELVEAMAADVRRCRELLVG